MTDVSPTVVRRLRITEPATVITDFVIAVLCIVFAMLTGRSANELTPARSLWALSFAFTAIAATLGGVVHGFALYLTVAAKHRLWKGTQYAMGLTGLSILGAAVIAWTSGDVRQVLLAVGAAKFAWYAAAVRHRDGYAIVVVDYGASMIGLALLAAIGWLRSATPASPWLVTAVVISGVGAIIQLKKIAPHRHFNHNDLYHVVQIVALYLFYRGGLLLGAR